MERIITCLLTVLLGVSLQTQQIGAAPPNDNFAEAIGSTGQQNVPLLQIGQGDGPFAAEFSPDRSRVVTGGTRGAFLWDVETGELLRTFTGHTAQVTCVAYSNDGSLVVGSAGSEAIIWDANTGTALHLLQGHSAEIVALAFSSDDELIATAGNDTAVRVWNTDSGELNRFCPLPAQPQSVAFSANANWLLIGGSSGDNNIRLWDWENNFLLRTWQGHTDSVTAIAFSPDERHVLSGTLNGEVKLWDFDTALEVHGASVHLGRVNSVIFSDDGTQYLTGSEDTTATLWDAESGERVATLWSHDGGLLSAVFVGDEILTKSKNGSVYSHLVPSDYRDSVIIDNTTSVDSVVFSPDGSTILTGGFETTKLWDVETGMELINFTGHTNGVTSVAFSSNGRNILTGSRDKTAKLWDAETGEELATFSGHSDVVYAVAFSSDGKQIMTGSHDRRAKLWKAETGEELVTLFGHTGPVRSVEFAADGKRVLTGGDATAKTWDAESGMEILEFPREGWEVTSAVFSPDETMVLTGSLTMTARLWDTQNGTLLRSFSGHSNGVYSAKFHPDGARILTGSSDKTARLWDTQTGAVLRSFEGHTDRINSVAFSPDGTRIVTGAADGARLWNSPKGGIISKLDHTPPVKYAALSPSGSLLLVSPSSEPDPGLIDARTGILTGTLNLSDIRAVSTVIYSADGNWLIKGGDDGKAAIHDAMTGSLVQEFSGHTGAVTSVALSPDGTLLMTGSNDKTARLWNAETGSTIRLLAAHEGPVLGVAFSPDGAQALTASADGTAKLWNLTTGFPIREFSGIGVVPKVAQFSPDGSWILTGSEVWNPATGGLIHNLVGHTGAITSAAISLNGESILTGSRDRTARLWSSQTGEALKVFSGHLDAVNVVALSPDDARAYTGSEDGAILSWELAPPRAIIVAGGGPYAGNSIARQTHELGVYTYRTLLARGYTADSILYLNAFPEGTSFPSGGDPVSWDLDGDGINDVDGPATRETLDAALTGEFAAESGRLLVLMMNHGYRTGDVMAFRLNPDEAVITTEMNDWLNDLQNAAPVDVTLVVDSCYSGKFVADCKKTSAIPQDRQRVVIASTSETAEAVFLPAPDLTSFMHTFLGSGYMGNSIGEAFRSGSRLFQAFPVAGQVPRIDDGTIDGTDPNILTEVANKQFLGASWTYGVQTDRNVNEFFPVIDQVTPSDSTLAPETPVTVRAKLLPFQQPLRVTAVIRQPAPVVLSGEPVVGLPRVELTLVDDDFRAGQVWEATLSPGEEGFPFAQEGPYRMTTTATFASNRISDPTTVSFTISDEPDPDASEIRAIIAVGTSPDEATDGALHNIATYAYRVVLDRFQDSDGTRHSEWIDLITEQGVSFSATTKRRSEVAAREALSKPKTISGLPSTQAILSAIATRGAEAERLTILLAAADASNGELVFSDDVRLSAADLDAALDSIASKEVLIVIDGAGSGSFLAPLAATGDQKRVIVTSGREGDCAIFLADPPVSFTQRLLGPLWSGENVYTAQNAAGQFISSYVGSFVGTRIASQLDDNSDGVSNFRDGELARQMVLGRSYAFAGDEASGLPFLIESEVISPTQPGEQATLRVKLLAGIEPARDMSIADPLDQAKVYAQFVPPGVLCGAGSVNLPRYRLRREAVDGWVWSTKISPTFLPSGSHPVNFYAEYPDGPSSKLSETRTQTLVIDENRNWWMIK